MYEKRTGSSLSTMMKTCALAWAAKRVNMTYGNFTAVLSKTQEEEIYREYEQYLNEMKLREKQYLAAAKQREKDRKAAALSAKQRGDTEPNDIEL